MWVRVVCRLWRCFAKAICLKPMKIFCPNMRRTADLESYLTAFLLLLISLLILYLVFGGHRPDVTDMSFIDPVGGHQDDRAALEQEIQMMNDLEHGQVVQAHMDVPHNKKLTGRSHVPPDTKRNPDDDMFDPVKVGKLPRILGGGKKEVDYQVDENDLHGFVGPERVYFYNHEEEPLHDDAARKARKEIKLMRKLEDEEKNEDAIKPDAVDEPGFHGFVGPETVIEYEHDDKFVNKRNKQRLKKAKDELLKLSADKAKVGKTRKRRSLPPPSRSLQSAESLRNHSRGKNKCQGCLVYNLSSPIYSSKTNFDCIKLSIEPKPPICLHDNRKDVHISQTLRRDGSWEPHIVQALQQILEKNPGIGVVDIGANLGVYTLVAAAMGHPVLAVEPYVDNIIRLQKAAQLANTTNKIILLQNVVSDTRGITRLKLNQDNQGGVAILPNSHDCSHGHNKLLCGPMVSKITMDDLVDFANFTKAVIKIDIEGHEHRAFRHISRFLRDIYVPFIVMEWQKLRDYYGSQIDQSEDKDLTWELVRHLTSNGYQASSLVTGKVLDINFWYGWPDDIIWKHELRDFFVEKKP